MVLAASMITLLFLNILILNYIYIEANPCPVLTASDNKHRGSVKAPDSCKSAIWSNPGKSKIYLIADTPP